MAISRKRNSPGIEINEIDRSQYNNKPDYSIVNTTTLICGFADKGVNYDTQWINSLQTLNDTFGQPTNEPEKYFYNAGIEILNRGGILLMSRLPYDNLSKDKFASLKYKVDDEIILQNIGNSYDYLEDLKAIDSTISSYVNINNVASANALISLEDLDKYKTGEQIIEKNTIQIVDITRKQYEKINMLSSFSANTKIIEKSEELLGIMPVIVSPINAMYFQGIITDTTKINDDTSNELSGAEVSEKISKYNTISDAKNRQGTYLSAYSSTKLFSQNFDLPLSSFSINDQSISKIAAKQFPIINFQQENYLDRTYLKQIGVVVFKVYANQGDRKKLSFTPVESFVGALDKKAKDKNTNSSIFIDDIINSNSQFINFFSNVAITQSYNNASTIMIQNQIACILGFKEDECIKNIDYTNSIIEPLNKIFNKLQDPNYIDIDIVCDAGVSNIAQYVNNYGSYSVYDQQIRPLVSYNAEQYPDIFKKLQLKENSDDSFSENQNTTYWKLDDGTTAWKTILQKYDNFCKNMRHDCIFIADVLRPFCLNGNQKIVRSTNLKNTIENSILPNIKKVIALNSSYSAGYCNWFYVKDAYTDDFFWLPPSIKAAGVYTYIDTYYHPWDAPAGMNRGKLINVYDTAFSPKNDEAGKIYQSAWNYAINYPIDGIVLEGQKTFQIEQTALDRINVRRLMLYLEKQTKYFAKFFLYEGNTEYIRQKFVDTIRPIFEDAKNSYGLNEYIIRCDETNNTQQTIDNNELRCAIAIKPVKSIEWIILDYIITNQSANINEEVLKS